MSLSLLLGGGEMKRSQKMMMILFCSLVCIVMVSCMTTTAAATTEPKTESTDLPATEQPQQDATGSSGSLMNGPVRIKGTMQYSNEFVTETYYVEHAVMLYDMTGFVLRDEEWETPVDSQILGYLDLDAENNTGTYMLQLPRVPLGTSNDVDQSGSYNKGVQIFATGYSPNLSGGPFAVGDDRERGWPSYLASVKTDSENQDEVIGGKLLIWSADDQQQFPSDFGEDGLLFTADDPVVQVAAGYTLVDLDQSPFAFSRDEEAVMDLYEPTDVAIKDYSGDSYTEAFNKMIEVIRKEYAFNGIENKQPDYDALVNEISPRIAAAEADSDPDAYLAALFDFVFAFHDGHVGIDAGDRGTEYYYAHIYYGYGLMVRELDNGDVIVTYVTPGSTADDAGIQLQDQILSIDDVPVTQAIDKVVPVFGPYSTDYGERWDKVRFLFRAAQLDDTISVVYQEFDGGQKTATLTAQEETESFFAGSPYKYNNPVALPVEYELLDNNIGYIRMNSNYDDLNLTLRLFERALKAFEENEVAGVIIDLRENSGGANLGVAGFFTEEEIPMGQLEYYSETTGQFEPEGEPGKVIANENQYRFDRMVTLVNLTCYSACELESYGLSQVPGMEVIGSYPTGGVEAETARGEFLLPEDITVVVPTGRFTLLDGSILLEGKGVQPTIDVPIDRTSIFEEDAVLRVAKAYILQ
jgi:C-terminal processing protease CtpA/Prc